MRNLSHAVQSTVAEIASINETIAKLQADAKVARKEAIKPFLEALALSGEVSLIVVRGSTPGFNDGEPCEHSADIFVNVKSAKENDLLDGDKYGFEFPEDVKNALVAEYSYEKPSYKRVVNEGALGKNIELCRSAGHVYEEPSADVMQAIQSVIFDTAEEENGTNYYVSYILNDGKFEVHTGEYDCGY